MAKDSEVIRVSDLAKRFGDVVAIDSVSFELRRGELFGLLGPNGAGKTTCPSRKSDSRGIPVTYRDPLPGAGWPGQAPAWA